MFKLMSYSNPKFIVEKYEQDSGLWPQQYSNEKYSLNPSVSNVMDENGWKHSVTKMGHTHPSLDRCALIGCSLISKPGSQLYITYLGKAHCDLLLVLLLQLLLPPHRWQTRGQTLKTARMHTQTGKSFSCLYTHIHSHTLTHTHTHTNTQSTNTQTHKHAHTHTDTPK